MTLQKSAAVVDGKNNGASSSGGRRPPGRPRGSKNKPKAPTIVTHESPEELQAHILEIPAGIDLVKCLSDYSRRRGRGLFIMSCSGIVAHVILRQSTGCFVALQGEYEILTLSGTLLPHPAAPRVEGLSLYVAGGHGQVIGGSVTAPLVASSPVVMSVASFANAMLERLPLEEGGANGINFLFNAAAGSTTNQGRLFGRAAPF